MLETAAGIPEVGELEEALRWGEPAYLTPSGTGSTIRLGPVRGMSDEFALFFNCQTTLVETFRQWFPQGLRFEGNRSIVFRVDEPLPAEAVAECVEAALTYHRRSVLPRPTGGSGEANRGRNVWS